MQTETTLVWTANINKAVTAHVGEVLVGTQISETTVEISVADISKAENWSTSSSCYTNT